MNTLTLSNAQLQALSDILHHVMCTEEHDYDMNSSEGNDQADHVWFKAAMLDNALEQAFSPLKKTYRWSEQGGAAA